MDLTDSLRTPATFEDGELWYVRPSGRRERLVSYVRKNTTRMFVNGKYIPKSNPLYQTGSPFRNYELVMFYKVSNRHIAERSIHKFLVKKKYNKKGEWFYVEDLEDLNAIFNKEEKKYEE